jgi:hypothetical protein
MANLILDLFKYQVPYVRELRQISGSILGALIMQQLDYWFEKYPEGFYKFLEPCEHALYKAGSSLTEELACSADEFRTAFDRIGVRHTSEAVCFAGAGPFFDKYYASYKEPRSGLTYYLRNHQLLETALHSLATQTIASSGAANSPARELAPGPTLPITKNTTKTTPEVAASATPHSTFMERFSEGHLTLKGERPRLGAREGKALKELLSLNGKNEQILKSKMEALEKLIKSGDKFWRQKPFVPSTLLSLWNHIQIEKNASASAEAEASWERIV